MREERAMNTSTLKVDERAGIPLPFEPEGPPALEVRAVYNGVLIGTRLLHEVAPMRRLRALPTSDPEDNYTIGQSPHADAPAPVEILGKPEMPLVSRWGAGFLINVTPGMTGDVAVGGKLYRLADYLAGRGSNFSLPANGRARLCCGAVSFDLRHTTAAPALPRPWFTWRWSEQKFNLGAFLVLGILLLLSFAVPPDGVSVSSDLLGMNRLFLPITYTPAQPEPTPDFLARRPDKGAGDAGKAHAGESGRAGDKTSKKPTGHLAIKGDGVDMHLGKTAAESAIRNKGILGVLNAANNSPFASIFGRDSAVGDAKEDVLGNLLPGLIGNGYGPGGLGTTGTGAGGGGHGLGTIGPSVSYGTVGPGYGRGAGGELRRHVARTPPSVTHGVVTTRGSLDKEVVRRVVRLHMNEVKSCYDQELVRKPGLDGRVSVQFVIAANGQVITSVLNSTTMNNARVESCVVDAVKRWSFPAPRGGGIVIVQYPFNFTAGPGN